MKVLTRFSSFVAVAAFMISTPIFAYTLSGTIPSGPTNETVINLHPLEKGNITFVFSAPPVPAGVRYALTYCIGPKNNPCNSPLSHVVTVTEGEMRTITTDALVFDCSELVVGQGTNVAVPYSVEVTQP
jgi:hypothetical protein